MVSGSFEKLAQALTVSLSLEELTVAPEGFFLYCIPSKLLSLRPQKQLG